MQAIRPETIRTGQTFKMSPMGRSFVAAGDARVYTGRGDLDPDWVTVPVDTTWTDGAVVFNRDPEVSAFLVESARVAEAA